LYYIEDDCLTPTDAVKSYSYVSSREPASTPDMCSSVFRMLKEKFLIQKRKLKKKIIHFVYSSPENTWSSGRTSGPSDSYEARIARRIIKIERRQAEIALQKYREELPVQLCDIFPEYADFRAVTV